DSFVVKASTAEEYLYINRSTAEIKTITNYIVESQPKIFYGIVGTIRLLRGPYLIIITEREKVGYLAGHVIFKLESVDILPFETETNTLSAQQEEDEARYLQLLNQ